MTSPSIASLAASLFRTRWEVLSAIVVTVFFPISVFKPLTIILLASFWAFSPGTTASIALYFFVLLNSSDHFFAALKASRPALITLTAPFSTVLEALAVASRIFGPIRSTLGFGASFGQTIDAVEALVPVAEDNPRLSGFLAGVTFGAAAFGSRYFLFSFSRSTSSRFAGLAAGVIFALGASLVKVTPYLASSFFWRSLIFGIRG